MLFVLTSKLASFNSSAGKTRPWSWFRGKKKLKKKKETYISKNGFSGLLIITQTT